MFSDVPASKNVSHFALCSSFSSASGNPEWVQYIAVTNTDAWCVRALKYNTITVVGVNERSDEKVENCDEENDK